VTTPVPTPTPTPTRERCRTCGRAVTGRLPVCFCCRTVAGQLGLPLVPLVALTEYRVGDAVHHRLRAYKDGPDVEVRDRCRRELVNGLTGWLDTRGDALAEQMGEWAVVTAVPSSRRPGPPPVEAVVDGVPALAARHLRLLVRGRAGSGHLRADRSAFVAATGVDRAGLSDLPVLVVDDTTTTGAAAQSAAAALRLVGARVVGVLVLGRALPPDTVEA
jgi:predicted amidophosphoribosyltransferase